MVRIDSPDGATELSITRVHQPRSVPLAPGVHPPPMMGPRFIPGAVEVRQTVSSKAEALAAIESAFEDSPEDDVPSIDVPAEKKTYKRKLEP